MAAKNRQGGGNLAPAQPQKGGNGKPQAMVMVVNAENGGNGNESKPGIQNHESPEAVELRPLKEGEIVAVNAEQQKISKPPPPSISVNESR